VGSCDEVCEDVCAWDEVREAVAVDEGGCDLVPDARCDPVRLPLCVMLGLLSWLLVAVDAADAVPEAVCDLVAVCEGVETADGDEVSEAVTRWLADLLCVAVMAWLRVCA